MGGRAEWFAAALLWVIAGLAFPFLTPATTVLSTELQPYLSATTGMSDELAYYVAFTIVRVPLTGVLGAVIAATQCLLHTGVRSFAGRWLVAATAGGCVSTLIWLPTTLIATRFVGATSEGIIRPVLLTFGSGLLAGLASFMQQRAVRRALAEHTWFVATAVLAAVLGALGGWALGA